ncbi:uncharacterized protein LOC132204488 [Neocloeon triangulifer]|uniref:uncharacterized protein LOC132204488 n=1 Tax=Neocloeon triangulifer TaxID=2078957 RepID=UPI00286F6E34|nr:uncharacterized protein LOC132204488 [Neocloeon triangulifer]
MEHSSSTGLLSAVRIPLYHRNVRTRDRIRMAVGWYLTTGPAPVIQRPFAGIYNPFPYRCSVLCNHPADLEVKHGLRRVNRGSQLVAEGNEVPGLESFVGPKHARLSFMNAPAMTDDWVPEELFRKYTETDSRPPSPAPTLASLDTIRNSSNKRSATAHLSSGKENKTQIVLDLRRSHSQDTLSWREMVTPVPLLPPPSHEKPPGHRHFYTPAPITQRRRASPPQIIRRPRLPPPSVRAPKQKEPEAAAPPTAQVVPPPEVVVVTEEDLNNMLGVEMTPRRRGVRRRGRKKSRGQSPSKDFQHLEELAETQVSMGQNSEPSERPSESGQVEVQEMLEKVKGGQGGPPKTTFTSFLSEDVIRQLQRQLDWHLVEAEFDLKRRVALLEAMRAPPMISPEGAENHYFSFQPANLWVSVPRSFSRRSARFELPMDSRKLAKMTPLQYAQQLVQVSRSRKLLYNEIFDQRRIENGMENELRMINFNVLPESLSKVMGREVGEDDLHFLANLLALPEPVWQEPATLDFRTFCGLCAIAERVLGTRWGLLEPSEIDPKHLVEQADFSKLETRLQNVSNEDSAMPRLLSTIKNS